MSAAPESDLRAALVRLLGQALREIAPQAADTPVLVQRSKVAEHGDYATNLALQLAKTLHRPPREVAARLLAALPAAPWLERAEIAGAGFVNFFLARSFKQQTLRRVLEAGRAYGTSATGAGKRVQVEFVSANPTGPLHVGHGRGAAYGASLANVLEAAGYAVSREYYVNDAGRQADILGLSTWLRYLELAGEPVDFPPNAYRGDYVRAMAEHLLAAEGKRFVRPLGGRARGHAASAVDEEARLDALIALARDALGPDFETIVRFAIEEQLAECRNELSAFGVCFDRWFSERSLHESGRVERAVRLLEERGYAYLQDGALWFRSSAFGDEKDRVLRRENGQHTYFAADVAYHLDKFERGYDLLIDIWGADHHGYVPRLKGALAALGLDPERLVVALVQFAVLYRNGAKVPMSTRAGEFVTLRELREEVGNDAARFFYVLRRSDQHLDFDLDLARSRSNDNPVYYVQYAHARVASLLEQWGGDPAVLVRADPAPLGSEGELRLLGRLAEYPEAVADAARELAPHVVAFYLRELAAEFHSYYNATRILVEDEALRHARLALAAAVGQVVRNGLGLLGVSAPEKM
jgi:arginyl-tRNA synthetase